MITGLLLSPAPPLDAVSELAGLERLTFEFPSVPVRLGLGADALSIDARRWRDPEADLFGFDEQVFPVASEVPVALSLEGQALETLEAVGLEVLTRYQSLIDRRNAASDRALFDRVLLRHRDLHDLDLPLVRADFAHSRDVWQWVLRLAPDAELPVQVAALFHDVERLSSEAHARVEQHAADYPAFKNAHALRGARMALDALEGLSLPEPARTRVADLVARHERPDADPDLALLNDADALSFFSLNSPGFLRYFGAEHTRKKVAYTLARLSPAARTRLSDIRLVPEIAAEVARHADACAAGGLA